MNQPITMAIGAITGTPAGPKAAGTAGTTPAGFAESLGRLVSSVESTTGEANTAVAKMVDGTGDVHDAMIALQRADLAFQFAVQVRNKLVQAYQDVMRMSV